MVVQAWEPDNQVDHRLRASMNCPVCLSPSTLPALSGRDFLFETTSKTFTLSSCAACRCLFLDPMPPGEEIAGFYPNEYWWSAAKPGLLKRLEEIYRRFVLRDHLSFILAAVEGRNNLELLDIGCGGGTLLRQLKRRGFKVRGVDFSPEAASVAMKENGVPVVVGSVADASFEESVFDVVTLFHVMEHVANPREVLAEVSRILKDDGVVVLQVPNIESWQFRWFGAKWYGLDIPRHVIDYSEGAMLKQLAESGLTVRRIRHFNLRDNAPALVSSLFPSLDPVSRVIRLRRQRQSESPLLAWTRHLFYLLLVILAHPIAVFESACGHGATVMIEARKQ